MSFPPSPQLNLTVYTLYKPFNQFLSLSFPPLPLILSLTPSPSLLLRLTMYLSILFPPQCFYFSPLQPWPI